MPKKNRDIFVGHYLSLPVHTSHIDQKHLWMAGDTWSHPTTLKTFRGFFSLIISKKKSLRYCLISFTGIDGQRIVLSNWTKAFFSLLVINWRMIFSFYSKSINLSFWFVFDLAIFFRPTKAHMAGLGKLGKGWSYLTTPNQKCDLQSFPLQKESKTLVDSLQKYWWSNNPAIQTILKLF